MASIKIDLLKWVNIEECEDEIVPTILRSLSKSNNFFWETQVTVIENRFLGKFKQVVIYYTYRALRFRYLIQKTLRRFVWKNRTLVYRNECDLILEPFKKTQHYPVIIENDGIYRFGSSDIYNMIIQKLVYSEYQEPMILPICNPYTNRPLKKIQLYNLFISSFNAKKTPWILIEFVKANFNCALFMLRHESYLREKAVLRDILNFTDKEFRKECDFFFKKHIVSCVSSYSKLEFNGLSSLPTYILRQFFTPCIVESMVGYHDYEISCHSRQRLWKLWELYPYIYSKKQKRKRRPRSNSNSEFNITFHFIENLTLNDKNDLEDTD